MTFSDMISWAEDILSIDLVIGDYVMTVGTFLVMVTVMGAIFYTIGKMGPK